MSRYLSGAGNFESSTGGGTGRMGRSISITRVLHINSCLFSSKERADHQRRKNCPYTQRCWIANRTILKPTNTNDKMRRKYPCLVWICDGFEQGKKLGSGKSIKF